MRLPGFKAGIGVLLLSAAAIAQQGVTKPVLSAEPAQQPDSSQGPVSAKPSKPASVPVDYIIGAEDSIQITVWKEPNLSNTLTVRPDGMISLPLLGDVHAVGMTPMGLGDDLTTRLKKYINDPLVTVTVMGINSQHVYMVGEIGHVGLLSITPGMTMLQAIVSAGGLTPYANSRRIYILRGKPGSQQKIPFDYKKAVKTGDQQGVNLQPGDTIVVP
jgi:polysaccharide export outer membrane protein